MQQEKTKYSLHSETSLGPGLASEKLALRGKATNPPGTPSHMEMTLLHSTMLVRYSTIICE